MGGWYTYDGTYTSGRGKGCQHRTCTWRWKWLQKITKNVTPPCYHPPTKCTKEQMKRAGRTCISHKLHIRIGEKWGQSRKTQQLTPKALETTTLQVLYIPKHLSISTSRDRFWTRYSRLEGTAVVEDKVNPSKPYTSLHREQLQPHSMSGPYSKPHGHHQLPWDPVLPHNTQNTPSPLTMPSGKCLELLKGWGRATQLSRGQQNSLTFSHFLK